MIKNFIAAILLVLILVAAPNASAYEYITYQGYVDGIGWMDPVGDGEIVGTTGQARRLEAHRRLRTASVRFFGARSQSR